MPSRPSRSIRPLRVTANLLIVLLASVFAGACAVGGAALLVHFAAKLQLKTPYIPPPPVSLVASYPMPEPSVTSDSLVGIAQGSDGNIWVSEFVGNAVVRFTPDGQSTSFPMPTASAGPTELAPGPDGNIWCTEANSNAIARITTAGVVTEFPLSSITFPNGGPRGIVAGSDGNLWFAHPGANEIGKMSPSGTLLAIYTIPTPNGSPIRPASGPDGNIWVAELFGNKIARINVATGAISEFVVPTNVSDPFGNVADITAGADGNMWFTERAASLVGRVTMGGTVTEFSTPTQLARPQDITSTPDGSLWFAEYFEPGLARIDPVALTIVEYRADAPFERAIAAGQGTATVWLTNEGNLGVDLWTRTTALGRVSTLREVRRPLLRRPSLE